MSITNQQDAIDALIKWRGPFTNNLDLRAVSVKPAYYKKNKPLECAENAIRMVKHSRADRVISGWMVSYDPQPIIAGQSQGWIIMSHYWNAVIDKTTGKTQYIDATPHPKGINVPDISKWVYVIDESVFEFARTIISNGIGCSYVSDSYMLDDEGDFLIMENQGGCVNTLTNYRCMEGSMGGLFKDWIRGPDGKWTPEFDRYLQSCPDER